jgi:hypothetical protein
MQKSFWTIGALANERRLNMKDQKIITHVDVNESVRYVRTPYKFCKPKKYKWLANLLWKWLHKLDALKPFNEKYTTWTYTEQTAKQVNEAIFEAMESFMVGWDAVEDYAFLIGGVDFQELTDSPTFTRHLRLLTGSFGRVGVYSTPEYLDIPIHVIPHMRGIVIVPKVTFYKTKTAEAA